jgi:hypothetical protein
MLIGYFDLYIPTLASLAVVIGLIFLSMLVSVLLAKREEKAKPLPVPDEADDTET